MLCAPVALAACQVAPVGPVEAPDPAPLLAAAAGVEASVEFRVEGVVQKHSAEVEQGDAEKEEGNLCQILAAAQQPAGEAIGPDRWQVGDAAEDQEHAKRRH